MIAGLLNLGMILAVSLAKQLGAPPEQYIAKAHEILRHIAITACHLSRADRAPTSTGAWWEYPGWIMTYSSGDLR